MKLVGDQPNPTRSAVTSRRWLPTQTLTPGSCEHTACVAESQEMKTLLKKAGIAVAAATAGLLAFAPLAFAGAAPGHEVPAGHSVHSLQGGHEGSAGDCNISQSTGDAEQTAVLGALNVNDALSDVLTAVPICDNNVNVQVAPIESPVDQVNK